MGIAEILLWPGTQFCKKIGVDPTSDAGLIRWMINTLFYTVVMLLGVWIFVV